MKIGDKVRVTDSPRELGVLTSKVRGEGSQAVWTMKLNRPGDGPTHIIAFAHELTPA